jgi:hypothetical protein
MIKDIANKANKDPNNLIHPCDFGYGTCGL